MKKKTIFDSKSELKLFKQLRTKWSGMVEVYNHMPVANVINVTQLEGFKPNEINYLWKTSFDFVVASAQNHNFGEPLLVIEFDGIGQGYSYDHEYIQTKEFASDPNRKWKMDTKLKAANKAGIPMIVVSDFEVNLIDENYNILDGIIGDVLAMNEFRNRFNQESNILEQQIKDITDPEDIQFVVDDYGIEREIESKMKYNPIFAEATKLQYKLIEEKIVTSWGERHSIVDGKTTCTYFAKLNSGEEVTESVGIRKINCKDSFAGGIATDIAELLVMKKIAEIYGI